MNEHSDARSTTITVVVPNYNHGHFLSQSLGSIARQTRPPDEVIIIDDASSDDSVAVIERIIEGRRGWRLVRSGERGGVIRRLNDGLAQASGEWVVFLGADDGLFPQFIERAAALAVRAPEAGIVSACVAIVGDSLRPGVRPAIIPSTLTGYVPAAGIRKCLEFTDNFMHGTVALYKREALVQLGGFDAEVASLADGFVARRLAVRFGLAFIPDVLGYWRQHGDNLSVLVANDHDGTEKIVGRAVAVLESEPSGLYPAGYTARFLNRLRFSWARFLIFNEEMTATERAAAIAGHLSAGRVGHFLLRIFAGLGGIGNLAALAWISLRQLPPSTLIRAALEPLRRRFLAPQIKGSLQRFAKCLGKEPHTPP